MVIGNGLIANHFKSYIYDVDVVIFASGVSNSLENDTGEFLREINLIKETISKYRSATFIYFSTLSIVDSSLKNRQYVIHKLNIEKYIFNYCNNFIIFRVSNLVGPDKNKNTMLNFFIDAVKHNSQIDIWKNAERNLLDVEDLFALTDKIIRKKEFKNQIVNIATRENLSVFIILKEVESFLNLKANYTLLNKGSKLNFNLSFIGNQLRSIEEKKGAGKEYLRYLLKKYY
jgi:nucleoside-diphosphate-sugar epimerase